MTLTAKCAAMPDTYFELIKQFPLVHIANDAQLREAQKVIDQLLQEDLDDGQEKYLDALTDLVEAYEDKTVEIAEAPESDLLRLLMSSKGISQHGLSKKVGIAQSTSSAVLNGSRSLTRHHVQTLAGFFNVSPSVFIPRQKV
jgi:HTH-type transcriptional regulator / antitoxin HigA